MRRSRWSWALSCVLLVLWSGATRATTISTGFPSGSTGADLVSAMESAWNTGGFACASVSSRLYVRASSGPCARRGVTSTFEVTSGATTTANHTVEYEVVCAGGSAITHRIAFDGAALQSIDDGVFDFDLSGLSPTVGDSIRITTSSFTEAPAVSPASVAVAVAVFGAALAGLLLRRRRQPAA